MEWRTEAVLHALPVGFLAGTVNAVAAGSSAAHLACLTAAAVPAAASVHFGLSTGLIRRDAGGLGDAG
jgi:hypothetical protein